MTDLDIEKIAECLALLTRADRILMDQGQGVLAAYLSGVIEPLRDLVPDAAVLAASSV